MEFYPPSPSTPQIGYHEKRDFSVLEEAGAQWIELLSGMYEALVPPTAQNKPGMVVHTSGVQGHPWLYSECIASVRLMRPCLQNK